MPRNAFSARPLKVFSDDQVGEVHAGALRLLETLGVRIASDDALDLLGDYGVRCDRAGMRAYPDAGSVDRALASVRRGYALHGRGPRAGEALRVGLDTVHTISGGAALRVFDGGRYRAASRQDMLDMIALHERLDNVHVLINVVEPAEMAGPDMYPEIAALHFSHGGKPLLLQASGQRDLEKIIRMASLIAGGRDRLRERPLFMTGGNAEPPLCIERGAAEVLIVAAREGVPCSLGSYEMAGSTGPMDAAGAIVQRTATVLAGLVLTQAARPGSAYDFSAQCGGCDLATGSVVTMSPQVMQMVAGAIQVGRHYGMVTNAMSATDSPAPDAQAAGERFFSLAACVMAGASLIQGATSEMAGMELADFAQCVLDDEIAGCVLEFATGVGTGELPEALRAIEDVVSDPQYRGHRFLGHPHTAERCRRAGYRHNLFSAAPLAQVLRSPREPLYERARRRAEELMGQGGPVLPADLTRELLRIAREDAGR